MYILAVVLFVAMILVANLKIGSGKPDGFGDVLLYGLAGAFLVVVLCLIFTEVFGIG